MKRQWFGRLLMACIPSCPPVLKRSRSLWWTMAARTAPWQLWRSGRNRTMFAWSCWSMRTTAARVFRCGAACWKAAVDTSFLWMPTCRMSWMPSTIFWKPWAADMIWRSAHESCRGLRCAAFLPFVIWRDRYSRGWNSRFSPPGWPTRSAVLRRLALLLQRKSSSGWPSMALASMWRWSS